MEVICPGYSRTGTLTMQKALEILGYPNVYHFSSIYDNVRDADIWLDLIAAKFEGRGTLTESSFDALLGHCGAVTDMPCLSFAPELISYYPDAKVVLVERDVDKWYQSWSAFLDNAMSPGLPILAKLEPYYLGRIAAVGTKGTDLLVGSGKSVAAAKARSREAYLKHYALVRSVTPKERLLEFSLADGWGPLCEFLGKPVPDVPFPHENDTARNTKSFEELGKMAVKRILTRAAYAVAVIGIPTVAFYMTRHMRR
ncbi:hypothetical protein LTR09_011127 [Extremus antarcticus]|uniref:Sulfotransferase n=1 Tax=Extremus antarcticus TaxID=702011 RepID=A0AAJ0D6N4_9PEZI|nr:hypothetical protein LTR09_011127 [Extremus antarcticus]